MSLSYPTYSVAPGYLAATEALEPMKADARKEFPAYVIRVINGVQVEAVQVFNFTTGRHRTCWKLEGRRASYVKVAMAVAGKAGAL